MASPFLFWPNILQKWPYNCFETIFEGNIFACSISPNARTKEKGNNSKNCRNMKKRYLSPFVEVLDILSADAFLVDSINTTEGDSGEDLELGEGEDF